MTRHSLTSKTLNLSHFRFFERSWFQNHRIISSLVKLVPICFVQRRGKPLFNWFSNFCILFPLPPSWFLGTKYSLVVFQFCTLTTLIHKPNTRKIPQNYMITLKVSNPKYNQFFYGISQHYKTQHFLPLAIHSHLI